MFLNKYLDEFYLEQILNNYDKDYLETVDESNFIAIYNLFKKYNFYFINDIILKYLEIFTLDISYIEKEILKLKDKLGTNYIYLIGNNITYLEEILDNLE